MCVIIKYLEKAIIYMCVFNLDIRTLFVRIMAESLWRVITSFPLYKYDLNIFLCLEIYEMIQLKFKPTL
jgi:hypothetical protein